MSSTRPRTLTKGRMYAITTAILCGVLLDTSAFLLAIPGDGSYVLLGLFSAPISFLGYIFYFTRIPGAILLSLVGMPPLWIMAAIIGTITDKLKRRIYLGVFLVAHYLGATVVLLQTEVYGTWKVLNEQWNNFVVCRCLIMFSLAVYLVGQIWLWFQLLRNNKA